MGSQLTTVIICALAAALLAYRIFSVNEAPSAVLSTLQYGLLILAVVGLVGSLYQMAKRS